MEYVVLAYWFICEKGPLHGVYEQFVEWGVFTVPWLSLYMVGAKTQGAKS